MRDGRRWRHEPPICRHMPTVLPARYARAASDARDVNMLFHGLMRMFFAMFVFFFFFFCRAGMRNVFYARRKR